VKSLDRLQLGKIKYTDFLMATLDKKQLLAEEMLYLTFQRFDIDNDGSINVHDLKTAIVNLSGEDLSTQEIEAMIADWDLDNNRKIDYQEFKRMMENQTAPAAETQQLRDPVRRSTMRKTLTKLTAPLI
jgi:Ca2+-binding EF-hand superfamily protein